jgi:acetolactate synthase small subunit
MVRARIGSRLTVLCANDPTVLSRIATVVGRLQVQILRLEFEIDHAGTVATVVIDIGESGHVHRVRSLLERVIPVVSVVQDDISV